MFLASHQRFIYESLGTVSQARKRVSQEALQPIKNVLEHKIYNTAHIPTELRFHFTSWALARQQSL